MKLFIRSLVQNSALIYSLSRTWCFTRLFLSSFIYMYCYLLFKALYRNENSDVIIIFMFVDVFVTYIICVEDNVRWGFPGQLAGKLESQYSWHLESINSYAMTVRLGCIIIVTDLNYNFIFVLIIKANKTHYFSNLFGEVLYMFQTGPPSIIKSISTLYTRSRYLPC
jgi:hypothetical protein